MPSATLDNSSVTARTMSDLTKNVRSRILSYEYATAKSLLAKMPENPQKQLLTAQLLRIQAEDHRFDDVVRKDYALKAVRLLVECLLSPQAKDLPAADHSRLLQEIVDSSLGENDEISRLLRGELPFRGRLGTDDLVKAFYLRGALNEMSNGQRSLAARENLQKEFRLRRTLAPTTYSLECFKRFASYTPLMTNSDPHRTGGGYFAALGGYGCVIDPGHHFVTNFLHGGRSFFDIDGVIITHYHDDHYADLPSLLSVLHQRSGAGGDRVDLFVDSQTFQVWEPKIRGAPFLGRIVELLPGSPEPVEVTKDVLVRTLPTWHPVFGKNSGVGLDFDIRPVNSRLIITGDTAWNNELESCYVNVRHPRAVLIAHVSTVCREEILGVLFNDESGFYPKHLGIRGLSRAIEAVRPAHVIISEVGEELRETVEDLAELVQTLYPCSCTIGWPEFPCHFPVSSVSWASCTEHTNRNNSRQTSF
jgi:hypothetical protein